LKYKGLLVILITLLFTTLSCFFPNVSADPSIIIYDYELSPEVFMPGDSGTLTLTIKNAEPTNTYITTSGSSSYSNNVHTDTIGAEFNNIWITAAEDNHGKQVKASLNYEDTGYLAPATSFEITFKIIAEAGITEGLYFPTVGIDIEYYTDVTFPIPVNVSNATIDLISTSVPSKISKSGSTQITFTAVNNRDSTVDNIVVTPVTIDGVEFTPESVFIESINSDSSEDITFSVKPIESGVKNLSFSISYKNGYNIHTSSFNETIEIIDTLDVGSLFTSLPKSIKKGESSRITLEVYNAKTESITGVIVTPISNTTVLPSQYFIGSMDPDDVFSASFDIFTDDLYYGNNTIEFEVSFKQGNEYYKTPTISTMFSVGKSDGSDFQRSESTSAGMQSQPDILGTCLPVILLIVIIIVVVFLWKWKKRRNSA